METTWSYEKLDEDYKVKHAPYHDLDGKITGHFVYGLKAWFDEHPEERKALGWIKHIHHDTKDIQYNRQSQYLECGTRWIDEYTIEDVYHVCDKSEEMMRLEEIQRYNYDGGITFYGYGGDYE